MSIYLSIALSLSSLSALEGPWNHRGRGLRHAAGAHVGIKCLTISCIDVYSTELHFALLSEFATASNNITCVRHANHQRCHVLTIHNTFLSSHLIRYFQRLLAIHCCRWTSPTATLAAACWGTAAFRSQLPSSPSQPRCLLQEEIRFVICPEALASLLITEVLGDHEAVCFVWTLSLSMSLCMHVCICSIY